METTRQRLLNIAITLSVVINLALLGGLGYIVSVDHHVNQVCSAMSLPVAVYVPKDMKISNVTTTIMPSAKQ